MNTSIEERLVDTLKTVGDTLGPEDVPSLELGRARDGKSLFARPMLIVAAAAASVAVAVGGVAVVRDEGPLAERPLARPSGTHQVQVFLCRKTSSNVACQQRNTTQQLRGEIRRVLTSAPGVEKVEYESLQDAWERFQDKFAESMAKEDAKVGDIPDSFRVTTRTASDAQKVRQIVLGRDGVDQVVTL
ncbi:permease-like cell division protein FtsX [Actinomadura sp. 6N118]|uniref:permease-like cell division protein FtsX n=1 Tax=Actinomadura sp. 6N118 TaxID=3375151 RepID=UPI0037A5DCE7